MSYHPNRKNYHSKLNQFNQNTIITPNKRNKIILIRKMRSKTKLSNSTPNMKTLKHSKK